LRPELLLPGVYNWTDLIKDLWAAWASFDLIGTDIHQDKFWRRLRSPRTVLKKY